VERRRGAALLDQDRSPLTARAAAWGVHLLTASGVVLAFLAALEIAAPAPDPRRVFLWLTLAVVVDAVDGPLARRLEVKRHLPHVQGRTLDDIVDYLTFTFLPLALCCRLRWVPGVAWVVPALVASLLGFAHTGAKQEADGFFRGFPSYWNIYAFFAGLWVERFGPLVPGVAALLLAVLTLAPVRFVYPNLAPRGFKGLLLGGAWAWSIAVAACLPSYPAVPPWLLAATLAYPVLYVASSVWLDVKARRLQSSPAS
jgi:phosphatidylcholine synthase